MREQLYASFMLDQAQGLEIALPAENVSEAIPLHSPIQMLPASIEYLEGVITLRENIIPVINLKKRLGLEKSSYSKDAKLAIIHLYNQQVGLLFDDIREVFAIDQQNVTPLNSFLQSDDKIISSLIHRSGQKRTIQLLDPDHVFQGKTPEHNNGMSADTPAVSQHKTYSRWVVFRCLNHVYGIPVKYSQEITFLSKVDEMFQSGHIEGAIRLRGNTVPVINARFLLADCHEPQSCVEKTRVLVLSSEDCSFGMVVDEIDKIITVDDDTVLAAPTNGDTNLLGVYPQDGETNIMLLDIPNLVCNQIDEIKSLSRINKEDDDSENISAVGNSSHLITENCYLIFTLDKNFAVELKDVQEIIETEQTMTLPQATGFNTSVINLRGEIVPIINGRNFYGYDTTETTSNKLIICKDNSRLIAMQVDNIVTIYKQEQYHPTPSLNLQLAEKKDTLDRLIEYEKGSGLKEHVLVVNIANIIDNYLECNNKDIYQTNTTTKTDTTT